MAARIVDPTFYMNDPGWSMAGVVLAGGASCRFGSDKRSAIFSGKPLIIRAYETLSRVVDDVFLSVDTGFSLQELVDMQAEDATPFSENHLITDETADQGPLGGIYSVMNSLKTDWLLVLATDLPRISSDSLKKLMDEASENRLVAYATDDEGNSQPLAGCYSRRLLPYISAALDQGEYGVFRFLKKIEKEIGIQSLGRVNISSEELQNVNRPEDLS